MCEKRTVDLTLTDKQKNLEVQKNVSFFIPEIQETENFELTDYHDNVTEFNFADFKLKHYSRTFFQTGYYKDHRFVAFIILFIFLISLILALYCTIKYRRQIFSVCLRV